MNEIMEPIIAELNRQDKWYQDYCERALKFSQEQIEYWSKKAEEYKQELGL